MTGAPPGSVLFVCDHNAVRSPIAEAAAKRMVGNRVFIQSAGVKADLEVDGLSVEVAREIGLDISHHHVRSVDALPHSSFDLDAFDIIVALSPAAQRMALNVTEDTAAEVLFWPILDPTGLMEHRTAALGAYREMRDQIVKRIEVLFRSRL